MVQDSIEMILNQKLGLDANSVGSRIIARAVEQRQKVCQLSDRAAYLSFLRSTPQELDQLIEAVVIPETWFFRDRGPFEYLQQYVQQQITHNRFHPAAKPLRLLSVPCSTGEEPYSIAITLLEAGMMPTQFQIDAVDVSQQALARAKKGVYSKKSFRGGDVFHLDRYFQPTASGYMVKPIVCQGINFIHGNVLTPHFLKGQQYDVIFCRNLLIYLDEAARRQVMVSLDQALAPLGLMFLGAVETLQLANRSYQAIDHPFAFAFQKQVDSSPATASANSATPGQPPSNPQLRGNQTAQTQIWSHSPTNPQFWGKQTNPSPPELGNSGGEQNLNAARSTESTSLSKDSGDPQNSASLTPLETAKQLADRGQLISAANLCKSYVRAYPSQASAYLLLGEIYQGLNQPRQAEQSFQQAIYLNPDSYEALIHLALLKEQQGHRAASERLRQRAQRLFNQNVQQVQSGSS